MILLDESMQYRLRISAAALFALLAVAGCSEAPKAPPAPPPPAVTVAHPVKRAIVDQDEYVGRFVAVQVVEVRARVSGYLESVHFVDGQIVKEGDLLFTIDKRPFQNTLDQARANLQVAKSNEAFTTADLARAQELVRNRTVTEQIYEQRAQANRNAQASVLANEALVRQAELDLEFTELRGKQVLDQTKAHVRGNGDDSDKDRASVCRATAWSRKACC
jgi:multidrug efflux pump subunit AcrA (membrane-fusion protein)